MKVGRENSAQALGDHGWFGMMEHQHHVKLPWRLSQPGQGGSSVLQ